MWNVKPKAPAAFSSFSSFGPRASPLVLMIGFHPPCFTMRTMSTICGCTSGSPPAMLMQSLRRSRLKTARSSAISASVLCPSVRGR